MTKQDLVFGREPVLWIALIGTLLALGIEFGLPLTDGQTRAVQAAVIAVLAFVARSQVTPNDTVKKVERQNAMLEERAQTLKRNLRTMWDGEEK